jgi:iron complex outermembrane recepter protein
LTETLWRCNVVCPRAPTAIAVAVRGACALLAMVPIVAGAQTSGAQAPEPVTIQSSPVVVTATRSEERAFSVPASIDAVEAPDIRDGKPRVNISEDLGQVPGVVANNRYNYAQDLQISSRGFGARSTFGVRGVRLMQDGIPLTMPDGQGQSGLFDLDSAARIEVLRGPFAALYGNSSGGVIQLFTQAPPATAEAEVLGAAGSYGTWRAAGRIGGTYEGIGGSASYSQFRTDGYRDWSWARRDITSGRVQMNVGPDATLTVLGFYVGQPDTQDPGGLTQQQVEQNRRQAGTDTVRFGTRKSINHGQGGAIYDVRITPKDTVSLMGYVGDRQVTQFLSFPGTAIASSGGVVDLDRSFGGVWLTWRHATELAGGPFNFTAAINYDNMLERRKGFVNNFGVTGALRRDEQDRVDDFAQYVQAEWQFAPRWKVSGGVRHTNVTFDVTDYFVVPGNPNDSGSTDYSAWLPVGGILYELTPSVNLYASAGKGFETPTFAELAYRPDGLPGVNFALQPARSNMYEAGVKSLVGGFARVNAAGFYSVTDQDIVSAGQIAGGRNVFTNAQQTTRGGFELSGDAQFGAGFSGQLAYTYLDASFSDYVTVTGADFSGKRIPGVPQNLVYASLKWQPAPTGFSVGIEGRYAARVYANDANTAFAPSYGIINLVAGWTEVFGPLRVGAFVRVDNVTDKEYIGSVIVNAANDRFFEPSPTRNVLGGVSVRYSF